jgi:AcrR family transcriptional regulator
MSDLSLKKKRMLMFFIEATQKIIERNGFDNVTIRKIAAEAGYNSATIYNYYKDLDHLLQFACMEYLIGYQNKLIKELNGLSNAKDIYFATWNLFASECYDHPKVYYHLFFSKHKEAINKTFYQYIALFDIKYDLELKDKLFSFIMLPNLFERHAILLNSLAEYAIIENKYIHEKATMLILIFESMLNTIRNDPIFYNKQEFINSIILYSKILLQIDTR